MQAALAAVIAAMQAANAAGPANGINKEAEHATILV